AREAGWVQDGRARPHNRPGSHGDSRPRRESHIRWIGSPRLFDRERLDSNDGNTTGLRLSKIADSWLVATRLNSSIKRRTTLQINDQKTIDTILDEMKTIAVIGLSSDTSRASYGVSRYMQSHGYRIIPINPN